MIAALLAAAAISYPATLVRPVDGDTVLVSIAGWPAPFTPIDVRIYGLDTPEKRKPPARRACEVAMGLRASAFAHTLAKPGDVVTVTWSAHREKYGRLLASITLPDGRDWAATMIAGGYGRAYGLDGKLTKKPWC